MSNYSIKRLTVKDFLCEGKYVIPLYQRNYDWGEKESLQLIEDIADYAKQRNGKMYYIGSAIVFVRSRDGYEFFETIDGQQRLTTLTIMAYVLKSKGYASWYKKTNLSFDHRLDSDEALRLLNENKFSESSNAKNIVDVYKLIDKNIEQIVGDKGIGLDEFSEYLFNCVSIIRIPVPRDTDLNHYFEIMNSRGEQLEKHEVLKASLLECIPKNGYNHEVFNMIWESCSNMNKYIQMNMDPRLRNVLFTDSWTDFQVISFDEICNKVPDSLFQKKADIEMEDNSKFVQRTMQELFIDANNGIKYQLPDDDIEAEKNSERFGSVINFQNFLLHTLKIMCYCSYDECLKECASEVKLDDKQLLVFFEYVMSKCNDRRAFAKQFIVSLLYLRYQYDRFVIKREYYDGRESWSLKRLVKYQQSKVNYIGTFNASDDNDEEDNIPKEIRMLEAMFHVSAPTQIYKNWLNATLLYVYKKKDVQPSDFRDKLYSLACAYMLDRYLTNEKLDFELIIYDNDCKAVNDVIDWSNIDRGCNVENFIFNFYDFIVWRSNNSKYSKFEFSYRTSVEHFYPQTPMDGYERMDKKYLDSFGNLCLISRSMNSKFSNSMPKAKYDNFGMVQEVKNGLSLKLLEMMDVVEEKNEWLEEEIMNYEKLCKKIIYKALCDECGNLVECV